MRQTSKNIFTYPLAAVTLLLLAAVGCDKQSADVPVTGFPEDGVVRVSTGGAVTRADGESLYLGTNLGLFIDYGDGDRHTMRNVRWTKETSDWAPDTQMLWKDATTPAALYAYAPYVEGETFPLEVEFYIPSDQTSGTTGADLVFWNNASFVPNDSNEEFVDGKVLITFSHALTKLTLNFEKASQFASDVTVKEVVLKDTPQFVDCSVKEGRILSYSVNRMDIKMHKIGDLQYDAIFYPGYGQMADSRMLEVTMSDGTILFYNVPSGGLVSGDLKLGKSYSMNMMLGKDKIEVIDDIRVVDWTVGDPFESSDAEIDGDVWDGSIATSFESGTGTETDPYIIAKASQLAYLAESVNNGESYSGKYFKQALDLSLAGKPWTKIGGGSSQIPFSGNFNGNGKKIYGLSITDGAYNVGLFGYAENASIMNCHVSGQVEGRGDVGGIAGSLYKSTMANCTAEVTVKGSSSCGGLCGSMKISTISDCSVVDCLVECSNNNDEGAGGIVGYIFSDWNDSEECSVRNCSVSGTVKGYKYVGGLVGEIVNHNVVVSDCTANVDLTVTGWSCGGLAGGLSNAKGSFSSCGFDGTITKAGTDVDYVGTAVGYDSSVMTFSNCWYNADKTGDLSVIGKSVRDAVGKDYSGIEAKHLGK